MLLTVNKLAPPPPPKPEIAGITLTLDREEAYALFDVLGAIAAPTGSRGAVLTGLWHRMNVQGFENRYVRADYPDDLDGTMRFAP